MVEFVLAQVILIPILGGLWYGIRQERIKMDYQYKKAITMVSFFNSARRRK